MQLPSSPSENDFDDRFLQCFGLGDPESSSHNPSSSQLEVQERKDKLRLQAERSPWYVY